MSNIILSAAQLLQLLALGPCLFMLGYLLLSHRSDWRFAAIPSCYFFSLASGFLLPLVPSFLPDAGDHTEAILLFNEHLAPELSFLLILQFILGRPPASGYWLILALPLLGGLPLAYLSAWQEQVCIFGDTCLATDKLTALYRIIGTAVVFMLLVLLLRHMPTIRRNDRSRRQRYWVIIVLILSNLLVPLLDLLFVAERIHQDTELFMKTMVNIASIFLVSSSLFHIFDLRARAGSGRRLSRRDREIARRILALLENERPYRSLSFNREALAAQVGLTEQHLSRIINMSFRKSFSDLVNEYRIRDAKELLKDSRRAVTSVAFDVGFSSVTTFDRVFKKDAGVSPREFRAAFRK